MKAGGHGFADISSLSNEPSRREDVFYYVLFSSGIHKYPHQRTSRKLYNETCSHTSLISGFMINGTDPAQPIWEKELRGSAHGEQTLPNLGALRRRRRNNIQ